MEGSDGRSLVSCHVANVGTLRMPRLLRDRAPGLWIGALALVAFLGLDLFTGSRDRAPVNPTGAWLGTDIASLLGPLITLEGGAMDPGSTGLRLWVLVEDRECLSCLDELPVLSTLAGRSEFRGLEIVTVALGDRHEARRTLLGLEPGMPVRVSTNMSAAAVLDLFEATRTPVRVLTWHGRVVGRSALSVLETGGEAVLVELLRRWSAE